MGGSRAAWARGLRREGPGLDLQAWGPDAFVAQVQGPARGQVRRGRGRSDVGRVESPGRVSGRPHARLSGLSPFWCRAEVGGDPDRQWARANDIALLGKDP